MAGLKTIDAIIKNESDKFFNLASIIENVQREDLNTIEEAEAYYSLM